MSELFVGLAQLVTEMQGKESDPVAQASIAELITYAEMLRMGLDYACRHFERRRPAWSIPIRSRSTRPNITTPRIIIRRCAICTISAAGWC